MYKLSCAIILVVCISICTAGCGEYELLEHKKLCKRSADSIFRIHHDSLNALFDSLCVESSEEFYNRSMDSLKKTRIADIQKLFNKDK